MKHYLKVLFILLLAGAPLAQADTKVYFSPNGGCQDEVISEINKAHDTIDIAMFSFTSHDIAHALLAAKDRHVKIRIILDMFEIKDRFSRSRYLIHKDFDVKFHLGPGLMHDKFAVIDDDTVLTGSYNWTVSANKKNSENMLVITDKDLADKYSKEYKHLWSQSGEAQLKESTPAEKTE